MKPHRIKVEEFPCKKLGYCPYGYLVENEQLKDEQDEQSCPIYGNDCPVFYYAVRRAVARGRALSNQRKE